MKTFKVEKSGDNFILWVNGGKFTRQELIKLQKEINKALDGEPIPKPVPAYLNLAG